jgi:hypothetical protein
LTDLELDGLRFLLEAGTFDGQRVCARLQTRNLIESGRVGNDLALSAGSAGGDVDARAGNGAMLRVQNRSAHHGVVALSMGCDQGDGKIKNNRQDFSDHGSP